MSNKTSGFGDSDKFELIFINKDDSVHPPITEIPAPTQLSDKFPKKISEVGVLSKFVTLEYIAEIFNEAGETEETSKRLLAVFSMVYETITAQPEHIEMLQYLEVAAQRDNIKQILGYSGGKIESFSGLIKQMQKEERNETPADKRDYGDNEPKFGSDSIHFARGQDRPASLDRKKAILERIKRTLEDYAGNL